MDLEAWKALALLACGIVMGAINNLAGAAGALGLVALEEVAGLGPVDANGSLRLGAVAIGLSGWLGFRSRGRTIPRRAWLYAVLTIPGAIAGAALALTLPVWVYRGALLAALVFVLVQQMQNRDPSVGHRRAALTGAGPLLFFVVGLHMGFVQVSAGLIAIAVLSAVHSRNLVEVNAAKMAVVLASSATATAVLAAAGKVVLEPAACLAVGCAAGSFGASRWSVDKGHGAVRAVVLVITVVVLARTIWQIATGQ